MLKKTGARTKNKSWISKIFSHATAMNLKVFVVPGAENARAFGLDINAAGLQVVDSPRHASVLLIIGELTPAINEAAIIIYAQMMRPRAVFLLSDDDYESVIEADVVTKISQIDLLSGVKQLRKIFKQGSFTLKTQSFTPSSLSIIKKYTCPMHPEILQDEPGSCPKCGMTLVIRELNAGESETKHIHQQPQHSHHKHKEEDSNSSETIYTCPMHPEISQDEPGSCPKCGMFLVPTEAQDKTVKHEHEHEHGHNNGDVKTQYTCPMHPEVLQDEPGSCPKCGMFLVETTTKQQNKHSPALKMDHSTMDHSTMDHSTMDHSKMDHSKMDHSKMDHSKMDNSKTDNSKTDHSKMDHSKTDHSKMDHSKMDHSKMDHSKMDHSKMDHSKMDHSKMDHSKADHSKMDHSKMSFMSMVDVTKDLPRSEDGLQMEWFDLPFGPFFPGLPAGLFINFTLDGDAVADCKLNQEFSIKSLKAELPMHAGCFFQRLFALNPLIHNCLTVLIQQVIENANGQYPNDDTQKSRIVAIEHERIINHLSWFCQLGKQTGMHNLARKAEALQLLLYKADFEQIIQLDSSLNGFVKYLMKIPFLKLRTQNIGKLSKDGGVFGPLARSMNIDNDVRSEDEVYKQFHFKPILLDQGDAYARLKIRALEINQSIGLIKNAGLFNPLVIGKTDNLTGSGMAQVESPRGKMMLKISFDSGTIQSFEMKTPSSTHIQLIGSLVHLQEIGDALIAIGSLDLLPTEVFQ